jgi:hypothetical protein
MDLGVSLISLLACNIPMGIAALQRLQHLGLRNYVTAPLPRSLSQLSRLTSLDVAQPAREYNKLLFHDADGPVVCCCPRQ